MTNIMALPSVGPYVGVSKDTIRPDGFRVLVYGAYNAMGLIGSEYNGIAVLDENKKAVVTDNLGRETSGYCGPSVAQLEFFDQLVAMPTDEFKRQINMSARLRYEI